MEHLEAIEQFIVALAKRASGQALQGWGAISMFSKINPLHQREVVTNQDIGITALCATMINGSFPEAGLLTEERYDYDRYDERKPEVCFVVDPIDGTSEYVRHGVYWSVSIAVFQRGKPVAGIVSFPALGCMLFASIRSGIVDVTGQFKLPTSWGHEPGPRILISPNQMHHEAHRRGSGAPVRRHMSIPCLTSKFAAVLTGQADAAVYLPMEGKGAFLWDYAAVAFFLSLAGGRVTSIDGSSLPYDVCKPLHTEGWLASCMGFDHEYWRRHYHTSCSIPERES